MDNKKKLTDDELEKVAGGYDSDMFYEDHRKEVTDQPPKHETWLQKDKLDDIPPSGQEYAKIPFQPIDSYTPILSYNVIEQLEGECK